MAGQGLDCGKNMIFFMAIQRIQGFPENRQLEFCKGLHLPKPGDGVHHDIWVTSIVWFKTGVMMCRPV